jgi:ribonuclease HI
MASTDFFGNLTNHPFYKRLLGPISDQLDLVNNRISEAIRDNSLCICTDGSYNPHESTGAHGWVIASHNTELWRGAGPSDGHAQLMTPYRAELGGIVVGLHIINTICKTNHIRSGTAVLYSDCEKAIKNTTMKSYTGIAEHNMPDADLVQEAKRLLEETPIRISIAWVEGHPTGPILSVTQNLFQQAHKLANQYLKNPHPQFRPSTIVIDPPSSRASITFENSTITSKLPKLIHHGLHVQPLIATICKEAKWSKSTYDSVDWEAFGKAFTNLQKGRQVSCSKLTHGIINTNDQNQRFYKSTGTCPCCLDQRETITHLFTCQEPKTKANRNNLQSALVTALTKIRTPERILECIQYGLTTYEESQEDPSLDTRAPTYGSLKPVDISLTQAIHAQNTIGWEHFLRGRLSIHWRKAYTISQTSSQSKAPPASQWISTFIQRVLEYSSALWSFRNGVVHGHTIDEEKSKRLTNLATEITQAYEQYQQDNFIISHNLSTLFDKPLQYILQGDVDFQISWLRTYKEAVATQQDFRQRQSIAARDFFKPRRPATTSHAQNRNPASKHITSNESRPPPDVGTRSTASSTSISLSPSSTISFTMASLQESSEDGTLTSWSTTSDSSISLPSSSLDEDSDTDSVFKPVFT